MNTSPAHDFALDLARRSHPVIPIHYGTKTPTCKDWQWLSIGPGDVQTYFNGEPMNVAVRLDEIVDVDLDCGQAIAVAPYFLPKTAWRTGRKSAPDSHHFFRHRGDVPDKLELRDPLDHRGQHKGLLVELRSGRKKTEVFGKHESGEEIKHFGDLRQDPATADGRDLTRAVMMIGAAALLARHWARSSRHDAALDLAGGLLRAGWRTDEVENFVKAVCAAAKDEELEDRIRTVADTAERLAAGENVSGWPSLAQAVGDEVVGCVREWLGIGSLKPAPAVPEPRAWPEPPAEEAFHGLAGRIVKAVAPASEASPIALLIQVLLLFGNAIGRLPHFVVESTRHGCNEFVILVGRTSGGRKGTSWARVVWYFIRAAAQWAADNQQSGLSSGEGLIWAVRDAIHKRERVSKKGDTVRFDDIEVDPGIADKRLMIFEPEFAGVLKQLERSGNTLSVVLRQGWDGIVLRTLTKTSPAVATGAHISVVGHITAEELQRLLTATECASGFGNRFVFICTDRSQYLPLGGRVDPEVSEGLAAELAGAIEFAATVGEMWMSEQARVAWCAIYRNLAEGKPGLAGALTSRAEAHVRRLSMIFALLDRSTVVEPPHLMAALAVWEYSAHSVRFLFGSSTGDSIADGLLRELQARPEGMTRTELSNCLGRNCPAERIALALGVLLQHKLARREQRQTGGRPVELWFAAQA
jgi:hypothetical protein